ncbi:MAG: ABC transporter permease [Actinomycetota bacterium]
MPRSAPSLWLRWSWRDLRKRWLLVVAISLILALGTGAYAGLGSTAAWRRQSNDESFALLAMHDLRVTLAQGATVPAGVLEGVVRGLPHAASVTAVEERLIGVTEVDASRDGHTVLVPGRVVGIELGAGGVTVDSLHVFDGRDLSPIDDGKPVAVLEHRFAKHHDLGTAGTLELSGGSTIDYVGVGTSPDNFLVTSRSIGVFAQAGLAVLFVPMATAQELLGQPGQVNELVLTLAPGTDREVIESELATALESGPSAAVGGGTAGATITEREDEPAWRLLYEDIEGDQRFWNIIAGLILAGATFAAFSLITRIVEAQRREIGIGMALGLAPWRLAIRPALIGAQIAVTGVLAGLAVGLLLDVWLQSVFQSVLRMPVFRAPFQPWVFARAAAIGFVLPLAATALPVWRAVRVQPVDAIRTGHLAARSRAVARRSRWLRLPGRSYWRIPARNLLRTPRRTLITALALGASITTMVFTIGLIDSFVRTMDANEAELTHGAEGRSEVELETFLPAAAPEVAGIAASPAVATAEPGLRLFGSAGEDEEIQLIIDLLDFDSAQWSPTLSSGEVEAVLDGGLVLSRKAADDLGLAAGDSLLLRHPERVGFSYRMVDSTVQVAAIHPGPMRFAAYLDMSQAALFGMEGLTNVVQVTPAEGVTDDELLRAVFGLPGVGSVQSASAATTLFKEALDEYFGVLRVAELIVLALALLIAFNAASISVDERAREHATMQAFGLLPRTVLGLVMVEIVLVGLVGTLLGILAGRGLLSWMLVAQLEQTMPDLGVVPYVSPETLLTAVALGVVAVAVAPLLTARRVSRIDIPSTLRVVE